MKVIPAVAIARDEIEYQKENNSKFWDFVSSSLRPTLVKIQLQKL